MNILKLNIAVALIICLFTVKASSEELPDGIYTSATDFINRKMNYQLNADHRKDKLYINEFLNGAYIKIIAEGKERKLLKKDAFGYRYAQQDYRFYKNNEYKIVDTAGFYLYTHRELVQSVKGYELHNIYYFSKTASAPILPLTLKNMEAVYPQNTKLRYLIEGQFSTDTALSQFDTVLNTYKIKYIYLQGLKDN